MYTLCLSGGGFRATLFHLGVIRRLIKLDLFKEVRHITSVSGGSIAAGMVMKELTCGGQFKYVEDFDERVIVPIIHFIQSNPRSGIYKVIPLQRSSKSFAKSLDKYLFDNMLFSELSREIQWTCYATSLNSMLPFKFTQREVGDSWIGNRSLSKKDKLSLGVSASAAFPPLFKPIIYNTKEKQKKYQHGSKKVYLLDGGVYDNLGSEAIFYKPKMKSCDKIKDPFIVSDASAGYDKWCHHKGLYKIEQLKRVLDISIDQNRRLRRRMIYKELIKRKNSILIENYKKLSVYTGSQEDNYKCMPNPPTLSRDMPKYQELPYGIEEGIRSIRTDLNAFHDLEIQLLIWNGMVKIDAALKRWTPDKIKKNMWNNIPLLKLDVKKLLECNEVLKNSQKIRLFVASHKALHSGEKLVVNISKKL